MNPAEVRAALRVVDDLGDYFRTDGAVDDRARVTLADRLAEDIWLQERVGSARAALQECGGRPVEQRAVASIDQLGLVARLVSPCLATASLRGVVPTIASGTVVCDVDDRGRSVIAFRPVSGMTVSSAAQAADALDGGVLATVVADVVAAYASAFRLSTLVLWGNVLSAVAGAAGEIRRCGQPLVLDPFDVVSALLVRPLFDGLGQLDGAGGRQRLVRHTCCLYYRVPDGGLCGDCVLRTRGGR